MKIGTRFAALVVAMTLSGYATASGPAMIPVYGEGTNSCGTWTAARRVTGEDQEVLTAWLRGLVTASGSFVTLRVTDNNAMTAWVDNYCAAHPLRAVSVAAFDLVDELRVIRKKKNEAAK